MTNLQFARAPYTTTTANHDGRTRTDNAKLFRLPLYLLELRHVMPVKGIEPLCPSGRYVLNVVRLPISPHRLKNTPKGIRTLTVPRFECGASTCWTMGA